MTHDAVLTNKATVSRAGHMAWRPDFWENEASPRFIETTLNEMKEKETMLMTMKSSSYM